LSSLILMFPDVDVQYCGVCSQFTSTARGAEPEGADVGAVVAGVADGDGEGEAAGLPVGETEGDGEGSRSGGAVAVGDGLRAVASGSSSSHSNTVKAVPMMPAASRAANTESAVRCKPRSFRRRAG
jgi:hypothetical protein